MYLHYLIKFSSAFIVMIFYFLRTFVLIDPFMGLPVCYTIFTGRPNNLQKGEKEMSTYERLNKLFSQLTAEQKEEIITFVESLIQAGESEPPSAPETTSPKGY